MSENLKRTPLYNIHKQLGARMIEFGGWEMPVQYSGIIDEHLTVRSKAGLFDLSHMGEIEIRGASALRLIQKLITNDAAGRLVDGRVLYTPMCTQTGGIVDDLVVYRFAADRYMFVVNAANTQKDLDWIQSHNDVGAIVEDRSAETVLIALQGRNAPQILQPKVADVDISKIQYYWFAEGKIAGIPAAISRTGYTGEAGFELYVNAEAGETLWNAVYEAMTAAGGKPVGLGARDTLRLEMRYCLYGNDIDETTTPLEAGLRSTVSFDKGDFIGRTALIKQQEEGVKRRLVGFQMQDRGVARSRYPIYRGDEPVGEVTSGAPSPSLKCNIGLAYLPVAYGKINAKIEVEIRGKRHPAMVVRTPFYRPAW
jgi:aminomethyltransferase